MKRSFVVEPEKTSNVIFYFNDVLEIIFGYIDIKELLKYKLISTYHCHFIRNCHFYNTTINLWQLGYVDHCIKVMNNHQFKNVDVSCINVNDENVHVFNDCKRINLVNTNISDVLTLRGQYDYIKINAIDDVYRYLIKGELINKSMVNVRDEYNNTLLMHCISNFTNINEICFMLTLCANQINLLNDSGKGVLYYVLLNNDHALLHIMLKHGLDYNILLPNKNERIDVVQFCILLKEPELAMMFIDCTKIQHDTLLVAIRFGYYDLAALLISKVNVHYTNKYGNDAIFYAVVANNVYLTKLIMDKIYNNISNANRYKLLLVAAKNKSKVLMNFIYNTVPTTINILETYHTKKYYDRDIANQLISYGFKVTTPCVYNFFMTHVGGVEDWQYFQQFGFELEENNQIGVGSQLLSYALDKKSEAWVNNILYHEDVLEKNDDWINYLVEHLDMLRKEHVFKIIANNNGANKNIDLEMISNVLSKCNIDEYYLIYAMQQQCCMEIINMLLCVDLSNPKILYEIIRHFNIYGSLFNVVSGYHTDREVLMDAMHTAILYDNKYVVKALLPKVNINEVHKNHTMLIYAIINKKDDIVNFLLKNGADVNVKYKKPPIYYALQYGFLGTLIQAGASINTTYNDINLLMYALKKNYEWDVLIDYGIDVNFTSNKGNSISYLIGDYTNINTILTLLEYGASKFLVDEEAWNKLLGELKENDMIMQYDDLIYMLS